MDNKTFTFTGIDRVQKNIKRLGEVAIRGVGKVLYQNGEIVMGRSKRLVPVNLGPLRASGRVHPPEYTAKDVTVKLSYGGAAGVYALYVHEGTGPAVGQPAFFPPVAPFEEWARRKLGKPGLGFVIARSVGQKGLKPRKFLERPLLEHVPVMRRTIGPEIEHELREFHAS